MDLPEGWKVGETQKVTGQWAQEWSEYVGKAQTELDIFQLSSVLSARKLWLLPQTSKKFQKLLSQRAKDISVTAPQIADIREEKPWHAKATDFPDTHPQNSSIPKDVKSKNPKDLSSRIIGEGDA